MRTLNPELSQKDVLINAVMGLCGESGECIDIVKKWLAQGHELDRDRLAKELGDVAWYLAEAATALEIPLEDILRQHRKAAQAVPRGLLRPGVHQPPRGVTAINKMQGAPMPAFPASLHIKEKRRFLSETALWIG